MSSGIAAARLRAERKAWRKSHPAGFYARTTKNEDGSRNLFKWECGIPGTAGGLWEGGLYRIIIEFPEEYPQAPPKVKCDPRYPMLWHMNVWSNGQFCMNIINPNDGTWHGKWQPTVSIREILMAVQSLLDSPNPASPSVGHGQTVWKVWKSDRAEWERRTREEAKKHPLDP